MDPAHVGACEHRGIDVDRIGGLGDQRHVAWLHQRPHQMRQPFLCPDGVNDLGFRVDGDVVAPQVTVGHRLAQVGQPARG